MPEDLLNKKEDIMLPEPTNEQIRMWDGIEESLNDRDIEITSRFYDLPDNLKKHLASVKIAQEIIAIGKKHQLPEASIKLLSQTVAMVLIGETNIVDFVKTLQEKCGLGEAAAQQLARDINQTIFLPVKESLKQIHQVAEWPREEQTREPAPSQPNNLGPKLEGNIVDLKGE